MSKSDLTVIAENFFFNRFKVFNDSIKIIVKTTMPDVFFDRLKLSEECLGIMVNIQKYIEIGSPMHAIFEAEKICRSSLINNFIDRCWDLTCEKASKLKTEKAQDRKFNEFYSMMEQYKSNFSDENIQHLKSKMREFLQP
ncbi:hypothetical protein SDC9_181066 [bioreactor metagenome]|uniref:Uncharacterized protein n=1 Tax=bioreactor metagenome TaxID=1076179 RepID=A0A645H3J8_9ZZZZ